MTRGTQEGSEGPSEAQAALTMMWSPLPPSVASAFLTSSSSAASASSVTWDFLQTYARQGEVKRLTDATDGEHSRKR